jgi:hypothetical protein
MDAGTIVQELRTALDHLRAGNVRRARAIMSGLGAPLVGGPPVPRAPWVVALLTGPEPRVSTAEAEIKVLLEGAQAGPFAFAATADLVRAALGIYGEAGLVRAGVCSLHEIPALVRPGAPLGPNEPLLRARLLALLGGAARAAA